MQAKEYAEFIVDVGVVCGFTQEIPCEDLDNPYYADVLFGKLAIDTNEIFDTALTVLMGLTPIQNLYNLLNIVLCVKNSIHLLNDDEAILYSTLLSSKRDWINTDDFLRAYSSHIKKPEEEICNMLDCLADKNLIVIRVRRFNVRR